MAFHDVMTQATRLTRAGALMEATALIQSALGGMAKATAPMTRRSPPEIIDLVAEDVTYSARQPSGSFEQRTYRGGEGAMSYRLYRPAKQVMDMPLVVMLHGCTQSPEDFARGTDMNRLADEFGFVVAYPGQNQSANLQRCWNWFKQGDQQRDRGEPALLAGITRQVMAEHRIDARRVYVAGLSAGGAAAAIMADCYPDLFAAVGIHSGLACGAAHNLPGALAAMKRGGGKGRAKTRDASFVPVITFHGDRDATVHEANSGEIVSAATAAANLPLEVRIEQGRSPSGRAFTRALSVDPQGKILIEQWTVENLGHAWSGGSASGSYTDPKGPDASREMVRFFLEHKRV